MKVKIRGLVFVGFAAAVFAQSAMADATTDAKTVTSKLYVDTTFQTLTNEVGIGGTGQAATLDALKQTADWTSNTKYPSMKVLSDAVGALDDVAGIHGDTDYISVTEDANGKKVGIITNNLGTTGDITAGTNTGRLATVGAVNGLLDTGISGTETNDTVPTSLAVQTYAEAKANKLAYDTTNSTETISAEATATTNNTSNVTFPTTKNVYEFVTSKVGEAAYQRKLTTTETGLYVGQYDANASGTDKSTWKSLEPVAAANSQVTATDYVTIMDNGSGVYQVNIPAAQIATTAALTGATATNDTGLVTAGSIRETILQAGNTAGGTIASAATAQSNNTSDETVPTTKNVYDFVTNYAQDTYQPKVGGENSYDTTGNVSKVMIGYTTRSGTAPDYTYSSEWKPLSGSTYVTVTTDSNGGTVALTNIGTHGVAGGSGGSAYTSDITSNSTKVVTGQAVHEFVMDQIGGLTIPEPTGDCASTNMSSSNDTACALVLAYWPAADSPTGQAGVGLKWVPMAQTVSSNP